MIESLFFKRGDEIYQRINQKDFVNLLEQKDHDEISNIYINDCRSDREFNAGHIKNAHHMTKSHEIKKLYDEYEKHPKTLFIFHCEFSMYRAPAAIISFLKLHEKSIKFKKDKEIKLFCAVLDGGYKEFYKNCQNWCDGGYEPEIPDQ